ncbi:MAG: hypothetical protein QG630_421 [Patescibacteria group bacterium]|nr:hypothetical protein [Patescibacteria group bacterium]
MENLKDDLIKKINEKIKDNKIKMKPKFYFVLQGFLLMSFILIMFLASLYIGNFILLIFHEHQESINFLRIDSFDFNNFLEFLKIIPGLLILLLFVFIFSLYRLIKDHAFVYRKNILYIILFLFLILTIVVINIHIFLDRNFDRIRFGEKGELPVVSYLHKYYRGNRLKPSGFKDLPNKSKVFRNREVLNN